MIPVVTPDEMRAIDAAAPEPVTELIARAGAAVAREAVDLLGGTYGRRVVVLAGKGNNGNDGRDAARRLERRGVRVTVLDALALPATVPPCDLVIDAAYGTGFSGELRPPAVDAATPVLAVDIPSGVDGLTGLVGGDALTATRTVTFAAGKPGLYLGRGPELAGDVVVADIGLDVSGARTHVVTDDDVTAWSPRRAADTHKWHHAVWVIAGSPGMAGAAVLACRGAQRAGAGYVRLSIPGGAGEVAATVPVEVVQTSLPIGGWAASVTGEDLDRFAALVVGNGLGRRRETAEQVRRVVRAARERGVATVVDADGLSALGLEAAEHAGERTVLTPHDGEFARLAGGAPGDDRIGAARRLAERTGAVVLLKGPTTVVARPDGAVLLATAGDARLATAGTGDVLAGIIGALCAEGFDPFRAAAAGAHVHGIAAALGWRRGLVAGDVAALLPTVLDRPSPA